MDYNRLTGSIPEALGELNNIEFLFLSGNELTGPIPLGLGRLGNLVGLYLARNELSGSIPSALGRLSRLERLDLARNRLTGSIPPELGSLTRLERLVLEVNQLTGSIPSELGKLSRLEVLDLYANELTGLIPRELGALSELHTLWLSSNRLAGPLPRSFLELGKLEVLAFESDGVCAPGASAWVTWIKGIERRYGPLCNESDRTSLNALFEATGGDDWIRSEGWLGEGALAERHGVVTDSLGRVLTLDLAGNGLAGRLPSSLAQLTSLTTLRIQDNALAGQVPTGLAQLSLREFRYSETELCIPRDASFRAWLLALPEHEGTARACGTLSDRDILAALYELTGGPRWKVSAGWVTDAPLDRWYGVSVDAEGRVDSLDLRFNNLTGTIPQELGKLANLRILSLWANDLIGAIPSDLGALASLETLWLSHNALTGSIPPQLGNLRNLRKMDLGHNRLTGTIPRQLGNLANLRMLDFGGNELTGTIPPQLGNLVSLQDLNLWGNGLTGAIPPELGKLHGLAGLSLGWNQLSGTIPAALGNLRTLRRLEAELNQLSGPILPALGRLRSLESLELRGNRLAGSVPRELGRLGQLVHMELSENPGLSGPLPPYLTALARIETVFMNQTDLCAPPDNRFRTWLEGLADGYVPLCAAGEREGIAYLTQAVEPRTLGVPLVGGEPALLRVFVTAARATSQRIPPVRATFYLNGSKAHVAEIPARVLAIPTRVDEGDLTASANAEIPGEIIRPGLEMVIEIDPEGTVPAALGIARRIPETGRMEVDVRPMPELDLTLIPFLWSEAPDSSIVNTVEAMAADPEGHEMLWATRTLLPVGDLRVTAHEPVASSNNNPLELLHETQAIRIMEGATGYYMGMLPDYEESTFFGVAFLPGRTSFSLTRATTIAHELGHNMSLEHAACGVGGSVNYPHEGGEIGVWGYDFRSGHPVPPSTADLMSYCRPPWISDYHFSRALRFRLAVEGAAAAASAETVRPVRSLLLWGGANADSVPLLEPAFVVDAPEALPAPGSAYEVVGGADDGGVLFSLSFDMPEIADGEGHGAFAFALPLEPSWARELASITLTGPGGAVTMDGGTDRPMTILRNSVNGQVRAFLRHTPSEALRREDAADVGALAFEQGLEALFSRGIPGGREWRR